MLAVDHGYFQGPTTGLRDLKKTVAPLSSSCGLFIHNKRDGTNTLLIRRVMLRYASVFPAVRASSEISPTKISQHRWKKLYG